MKKTCTRILGLLLVALAMAMPGYAQCPTPACTPGTATNPLAASILTGIYSVTLGTNTYPGNGYAEGYRDSSCGRQGIVVLAGNSFNISITTSQTPSINENVRVYLDMNNDGVFDSSATSSTSELVFSSNGQIHNGTITVPTTAVQGHKLRLRIATDAEFSTVGTGLPSPCRTPEYGQTKDFYVISFPNTAPPQAAFTSPDSFTCTGTVHFQDESFGAPTHWLWQFGDGGTDTARNPTHFYAAANTYSVTLIVSNAHGSDTLTHVNMVSFNDSIPAASCVVGTNGYCCGYGILRVTIAPISGNTTPVLDNASSNGSVGFENFTCGFRTRLTQGRRYRLALTTSTQPQHTKVWIDANGNGTYEASELVLDQDNIVNPVDTFLAPAPTGAAIGKTVRMRIQSGGAGTTVEGCQNVQSGQGEDYTIVLTANTLPPIAGYVRLSGTNCDSSYTFRSTSENAISNYRWIFGDGSVDTTSGAIATHTYAAPGTYNVTLTVTGPFGTDSYTSATPVTYVSAPAQATCGAPGLGQATANLGILHVRFGNIDVSSGSAQADSGYKDFTCQGSGTFLTGVPYSLSVTTGAQRTPETVRAWIDFNNDHVFDDATERVMNVTNLDAHTASVVVPGSAVLNTPLRMRVISYVQQGGPAATPCSATIDFGQAEDYSVVVLQNVAPPTAGFGALSRTSCSGCITFIDSSVNAAHYAWSFGDTTAIDTSAAPQHCYAHPGTYTVSLRVSNQYGADSITRLAFIHITANLNIAAASCQPAAQQAIPGFGITNVQFNTIDNTTGVGDGYQDYTCSQITYVGIDSTLELSITTANQQGEFVAAWIDFNSDGQFSDAEKVVTGLTNGQTPLVTSVHISGTAVVGRGLRVRVMSDARQGPTNNLVPCAVRFGQAEDYTVVITANITTPPVAGFTATNRAGCNGLVHFTDSSLHVPTSHHWDFGDGSTDTSASPTHQYTVAGDYAVKLKVGNAFGFDSLIRTAYVSFHPVAGIAASSCSNTYTNVGTARVGFNLLRVNTNTVYTQTTTPLSGLYEDLSCHHALNLLYGDSVIINATTGQPDDSISVWLDLNNDGIFTTDERLGRTHRTGGANGAYTERCGFVLPGTALANTPMRLRVVLSSNPQTRVDSPIACGNLPFGQAVDIVVRATRTAPHAAFAYNRVGCSLMMQTTQQTTGGAEHYSWDFGDGSLADTSMAPSHTYAAAGSYVVTLIVSNSLGRDTISHQVVLSPPPPTASCQPVSTQSSPQIQLFSQGVTQVLASCPSTLSTFTSNSNNATEGYLDRACAYTVEARRGDLVILRLTQPNTFPNQRRFHAVYVDMDNDGTFDPVTELVDSSSSVGNVIAAMQFNVNASLLDGLYRMRVEARYAGAAAPTCATIMDGQYEDYGLVVNGPLAVAKTLAKAFNLQLAPNPANAQVRLTAQLPTAAPARLVLVDATGRIVMTRDLASATVTETLSLDGLGSGVYQAVLTQGGQRSLQRLVVER